MIDSSIGVCPTGAAAISLTDGRVAIVDESMVDLLSQWLWSHENGYARCWNPFRRGPQILLMHRLVAGLAFAPANVLCDHANGNTLDNRRSNLRPCTNQQNMGNRKKRAAASSRYRGVGWNKERRMWKAYIRMDKRLAHLGYYADEAAAALAYNRAAVEHFGDFARLNVLAGG